MVKNTFLLAALIKLKIAPVTAIQALKQGLRDITEMCGHMEITFSEACKSRSD